MPRSNTTPTPTRFKHRFAFRHGWAVVAHYTPKQSKTVIHGHRKDGHFKNFRNVTGSGSVLTLSLRRGGQKRGTTKVVGANADNLAARLNAYRSKAVPTAPLWPVIGRRSGAYDRRSWGTDTHHPTKHVANHDPTRTTPYRVKDWQGAVWLTPEVEED